MAMSDKEKTLMKASLALLAIVSVYLILRKGGNASYSIENPASDFTVNGNNVTEGNPFSNFFNSENNINLNTIGINELSQKYIPLFGLVGMTAVGGNISGAATGYAPTSGGNGGNQVVTQLPSVYVAAQDFDQYRGYIGQYYGANVNMTESKAYDLYRVALTGRLPA